MTWTRVDKIAGSGLSVGDKIVYLSIALAEMEQALTYQEAAGPVIGLYAYAKNGGQLRFDRAGQPLLNIPGNL